MNTITKLTADEILDNSIIETFHGDEYGIMDYDNDGLGSIVSYNRYRDEFKVTSTPFDLTEKQIDRMYKMLMNFLEDNNLK